MILELKKLGVDEALDFSHKISANLSLESQSLGFHIGTN